MNHNIISVPNMPLVVPVYKPVGKTPLECVDWYKSRYIHDPTITVSYAGRLDPMAEGVLLLLVGEANTRRREYEHLAKEYEVTVLVGFTTDTGDLMGKIIHRKPFFRHQSIQRRLEGVLGSFIGSIEQRYPIYSLAKVKGKALYYWARKGRIHEIEIPTHQVTITRIRLISQMTLSYQSLEKYIIQTVGNVKGDFRQTEIIADWRKSFDIASDTGHSEAYHQTKTGNDPYHQTTSLFTIHVSCGSGTYMRQLVIDIGRKLKVPLCVYAIKRTRVGAYGISSCMRQSLALPKHPNY